MKLSMLPSECDCAKCSFMCHAPCCGTPDDMNALMDAGYGNRLMYDELPGGETMLKPALRGFEGKYSPWQTASLEGCTFWKDGKCELHESGLKPSLGKLVIHDMPKEQLNEIANYIENSWRNKNSKKVLKRWKKINDKVEMLQERTL